MWSFVLDSVPSMQAPILRVRYIVGGVISPLLLNVELHGMEEALGAKRNGWSRIVSSRAVVRYANDFVVFCE